MNTVKKKQGHNSRKKSKPNRLFQHGLLSSSKRSVPIRLRKDPPLATTTNPKLVKVKNIATETNTTTILPRGSLWDYDYDPNESSDCESDFSLGVDIDIVGGETVRSRALPKKSLEEESRYMTDQIDRADIAIQSTAPLYIGWKDTTSIAVPPSTKFYAGTGLASKFLGSLHSAAEAHSKPAHSIVVDFLSIIRKARVEGCSPYLLMKQVWQIIRLVEDDERGRIELAHQFNVFLPEGYSMIGNNCFGCLVNDKESGKVFLESCARVYLAWNAKKDEVNDGVG